MEIFFISGEAESLCKKWEKSSKNYHLRTLLWNNNVNTPEPRRACFGVGAQRHLQAHLRSLIRGERDQREGDVLGSPRCLPGT